MGLAQNRPFLRLWAAQAVSAVGSRITRTALPVIAVLAVDGTATELGILAALSVAPGALIGILFGGAVDRSRKRPILIGADIARALLVLTIPFAAWYGALTMAQLYVVAAAVGCATTLFQITDNAYLPRLVKRDQLVAANARLESTEAIAEIAAPGLAGILIELITAPITMIVDAVSYLVSALFLGSIRATEQVAPRQAEHSLADDLTAGLSACWRDRSIRALLLATSASTFFGGFFFALYMIYTLDTLTLSPGTVGVIISFGGVGGLLGAVLAPRLSRALGSGAAMMLTLSISQLALLIVPLAAGPHWAIVGLLVAHQLVDDGFGVAFHVRAVSLRQELLDIDLLARANATFHVATSALLPLGALIAGFLADGIGIRESFFVGAAGGLIAPAFLWPLLRLHPRGAATAQRDDT